MTFEKTKFGLLIAFIGVVFTILGIFVPTSIILFSLLAGFLFVIPILAISLLVVIGASIFSKKPSKSKKDGIVIST